MKKTHILNPIKYLTPHTIGIIRQSFYQLLVIYSVLVLLSSFNLFFKYSLQMQVFAIIISLFGISIFILKPPQKSANNKDLNKFQKNITTKFTKLERNEFFSKNKKTKSKHHKKDSQKPLNPYLDPDVFSENNEKKEKDIYSLLNSKILHVILLIIALILIIFFRTIPYFNNDIPLGYDTGLYKYGIEHGLENKDLWILRGGMEPGFLYFMEFFKLFLSIDFILKYLLIIFCATLGLALYFMTKNYFDKNIALISLFIYTFSIIQYQTFWYMYYKNIIGIMLALFAFYLLKKHIDTSENIFLIFFVLIGGFLGSIHRPSFYIFGLSYFFYAFSSPINFKLVKKYDFKKLLINIFSGIMILIIAGLFYIGDFRNAILVMIDPVLSGFSSPGDSPGTFISLITYQFSSLYYLPFSLLGLYYIIRKKMFNPIFYWTIISLAIVYFQFFFFNRFIIFLDIMLIVLSGVGFMLIIKDNKKIGIIILTLMLISASFVTFNEAQKSSPLISDSELETIKHLETIPKDAYAMSLSSYYSPWLQGYANRKIIAPGLLDYDLHNKEQWSDFWTTSNSDKVISFMNEYKEKYNKIYIFSGSNNVDNMKDIPECFEVFYKADSGKSRIYHYIC